MQNYLIRNARIVNEGRIIEADLLIVNGRIEKIGSSIDRRLQRSMPGKIFIAGVIDDQVHFREPGLTHKANIYTESGCCCRWRYQFHGNAQHHSQCPHQEFWKINMRSPQPNQPG